MFDIEEARGRVRDLRMSTIQSYNATAALLDACDEIETLRAERDAVLAHNEALAAATLALADKITGQSIWAQQYVVAELSAVCSVMEGRAGR